MSTIRYRHTPVDVHAECESLVRGAVRQAGGRPGVCIQGLDDLGRKNVLLIDAPSSEAAEVLASAMRSAIRDVADEAMHTVACAFVSKLVELRQLYGATAEGGIEGTAAEAFDAVALELQSIINRYRRSQTV